MNGSPRCLFQLALLPAFLCGCGGEEAPSRPPQQAAGLKRAGAEDGRAPAVPRRAPRSEDTQSQPTDTPKQQPAVAPEDRDDLFAIVDGQPNYAIVGTEPKAHSSDRYLATPPRGHADSATFTIVERPAGEPPGEPNPQFQLPPGFAAVPEAGYSERGLPRRIVGKRDSSRMALVPAGTFLRGCDAGPSNCRPEHTVHLGPYYMNVTEVTMGQFAQFMAARKQSSRRLSRPPANRSAPKDHPVVGISWGTARAFAAWAGKDLPTEAEWEKAARGPHGFDHPWGDSRAVWPRPRNRKQIDPVQSFRTDRSPYGIFDLAGNAREWCRDWYADDAYRQALAGSETPLRNPKGPQRPSPEHRRVVKGNGPAWKAWHRSGHDMTKRPPTVGFRCVLRVRQPPMNN